MPENLCLHERELAELKENFKIAKKGDVIVINGVWGFGKTELIKKFEETNSEANCINIDLWNSGFEKNVLYYFYQKINEGEDSNSAKDKENSFLNFYRKSIITLPILFVLSTFLLINYFIPILRKLIPDNNTCVYWLLLILGIVVMVSLFTFIFCYIKRNIAKYIVFKKDFNSFFHKYFIKQILTISKEKKINCIIIEDVDRLEPETIRELTTVIDSLKKEIEIGKYEIKFIVSFNALKLLVPNEKDQQPEYYFDKVENYRVNMGSVAEKSVKLFYAELEKFPEIKNHNSFDKKVLGESFEYFQDTISLRFVQKFIRWYEGRRKDTVQEKHPANMFVDFWLQQKYNCDESKLFNMRSTIENLDSIKRKEFPDDIVVQRLNDMTNKSNENLIKYSILFGIEPFYVSLIQYSDFFELIRVLFLPVLPYENYLYRYDKYKKQVEIITELNSEDSVNSKVSSNLDFLSLVIEQKPSRFLVELAQAMLKKDTKKFKEYVITKKELLKAVLKILTPLNDYWDKNVETNKPRKHYTIETYSLYSFLESGNWIFFEEEIQFLNPGGEQETVMNNVSQDLSSLIEELGEEYEQHVDVVKWFVLLWCHEKMYPDQNVINYVEAVKKTDFYNVFLDLKETVEHS